MIDPDVIKRVEVWARDLDYSARRNQGWANTDAANGITSQFAALAAADRQLAADLTALLEAVKAQTWQPIETARRVGRDPVLVTDGAYVGQGRFHPGECAWIDCDGIVPTMWQPLPAPPGPSLPKSDPEATPTKEVGG